MLQAANVASVLRFEMQEMRQAHSCGALGSDGLKELRKDGSTRREWIFEALLFLHHHLDLLLPPHRGGALKDFYAKDVLRCASCCRERQDVHGSHCLRPSLEGVTLGIAGTLEQRPFEFMGLRAVAGG